MKRKSVKKVSVKQIGEKLSKLGYEVVATHEPRFGMDGEVYMNPNVGVSVRENGSCYVGMRFGETFWSYNIKDFDSMCLDPAHAFKVMDEVWTTVDEFMVVEYVTEQVRAYEECRRSSGECEMLMIIDEPVRLK